MDMDKKYLYIIQKIFSKNEQNHALGKKMFQKLFYLIEQRGIDLKLGYMIHFYGPYSSKLDSLIHEYEFENYLNIDTSGITHIINKTNDFPKNIILEDAKEDEKINFVLDTFLNKSPRDLEALTTLDYVSKHIQADRKNENNIIADVLKIKGDKFLEKDLKKYYSELKRIGYLKN